MKKESFLIYNEWYPIVKHLSDESLGRLFRAIYEYQVDGSVTNLEEMSPEFMAFQFFRNQFDRDLAKYEERCKKNRDNINKRWNSNEYDRKKSNTKDTDNDNVKDNEKEKEQDNGKDNELVFPFPNFFKPTWAGWLEYKKKEHRFRYKSVKSEQIALNQLYEISEGDPKEAFKIIELAIASGWKGLFKRKASDQKKDNNATLDHLEEIKTRLS